MFPAPIDHRRPWVRAGYRLAVLVVLGLWMLPLIGVALTSIRPLDDLAVGNVWGWPTRIMLLENYRAVLANPRMLQFMLNSVLITVPVVAATVVISSLAGFALAKHQFAGSRLLLLTFVAGNLVPFQALMIPERDLFVALGLYDTRWALILFHTAFQTGFATLLMRNFIRELPDALLETARMEGASELTIYWRIVLPMTRPGIAALSVLLFTFVWNDYFWSLVLVQSDDVRPLTAGLQSLRGMWQTSWQLVTAGSLVAAMPPVLLFFVMQRYLVAGLTYGTGRG